MPKRSMWMAIKIRLQAFAASFRASYRERHSSPSIFDDFSLPSMDSCCTLSEDDFGGVRWSQSRQAWRATITEDGVYRSLGTYRSKRQAAMAYNEAARGRRGYPLYDIERKRLS